MGDVLFVIDPLPALVPGADSTYVMILEAQRRGLRVFAATLQDLLLAGPEARAHATPIAIAEVGTPVLASGEAIQRALAEFSVVLMRKDPPFDQGYLTATWILDRAKAHTLVLNDPAGLRHANEKLSIFEFPDLIPQTRILRREDDLRAALDDFGGQMIVKPVFGFGGREVLRARKDDPNLGALFELATQEGTRWTVAQAFVPEAADGDKRILLVDGDPIGAVLRVPAKGEGRNNFHAGGTAAKTELSDRDREICTAVGPYLRAHGQFFAGIDVIGGCLTEINVTSPTGMQEINRLEGLEGDTTMEAVFWSGIQRRLQD